MLTANQVISIKNRENTKNGLVLGPKSLKLMMIVFFGILVLFYLAQNAQGATKKYDVNTLKTEKEELITQKEQLEVEAARLQSLGKVEEGSKTNNLTPVKEIETLDSTK